ncbi:MAG TPA: alpha/beta hydrolase [Trueperaceae bacterium]
MNRRRSGSFKGTGGTTLHTLSWNPEGAPRALVVVAHGYGEHAGRYDELAIELSGRGMAVRALDFAGHGKSGGRKGEVGDLGLLVDDLGSYVESVRKELPELRCGLVGHSVGGAVSALLLERRPRLTDALVLSAPYLRHGEPVSPGRLRIVRALARYFPRLGVDRVDASKLSRLPTEIEAYRNDPLVFHGKASAGTVLELFRGSAAIEHAARLEVPLLLLHGSEDRIADPAASGELARRAGSTDVTFELVAGGMHELLNDLEQERIRERIGDWLEARLLED